MSHDRCLGKSEFQFFQPTSKLVLCHLIYTLSTPFWPLKPTSSSLPPCLFMVISLALCGGFSSFMVSGSSLALSLPGPPPWSPSLVFLPGPHPWSSSLALPGPPPWPSLVLLPGPPWSSSLAFPGPPSWPSLVLLPGPYGLFLLL
ncbi:uncharacterized protein BJ212DRAFT_1490241 [Suillus subaureus]|uniref:Uncharacterized protein n=1 Tax=Suillus subaureus TaxID=48587 RepID=A0A9P7DHK6_9AGAM|nr:uncharacterized protein BJ212DRAFT_1490241 [Suillus subaureus]KAG1793807.1 hypothetical protein BJ212DRAFT_1490241 [Suillus subaureus]